LQDGRTLSALEIQSAYLVAAQSFTAEFDIKDDMTIDVLKRWSEILELLESDKMVLASRIDWIAKLSILHGYLQRDNRGWIDPRLSTVDLQYADLRSDKGLALMLQNRGHQESLFTESQIAAAVANPPIDTRAYFRGRCVSGFGDSIHAASWDSLIFEINAVDDLIRVLTPDARKGTELLTKSIFDQHLSVQDFLTALSASNHSAIG
jgi:proteasome accessory factor A